MRVDVDRVLPEHVLKILWLDGHSKLKFGGSVEHVLALVDRHGALDVGDDSVDGLNDSFGVTTSRRAEDDVDPALGRKTQDVVAGVLRPVVEHDGARVDRGFAPDDLGHAGLLTLGVVVDDDELGDAVPQLELEGVASPGDRRPAHLSDQGAHVAGCGCANTDTQSDEPAGVNVDGAENHCRYQDTERAEDGNGLIVRFYESQRRRGNVTLTCAFPLRHVQKVNLLEEEQETLIPDGNQVTLFVKPYEIVSLRLVQDV